MSCILDLAQVGTLPTCSPNLMPFHIKYSGNAPLSTYMIVKQSSSRVGAPPNTHTDAQYNTGRESLDSSANNTHEEAKDDNSSAGETVDTVIDTTPRQDAVSPWRRVAARFVSAFRGRAIHGLRVEVPKGYVGVVLRASPGAVIKKRQTIRNTENQRTRGRRAHDFETDQEESGDDRTLRFTNQFSSLVLWHPDYPVDEGKDEYYRSLTEWTKLASIIHRVEE